MSQRIIKQKATADQAAELAPTEKSRSETRLLTDDGPLTSRGRSTVERIYATAMEIFAVEGYGGLTMRKVASSVGVSLSNLQHYFDGRDDLIAKIITRYASEVMERYRTFLGDLDLSYEERFEAVLRYLISENKIKKIQSIFFNIYALAQTHEFARHLIEVLYREHCQIIAGFIREINPTLTDNEAACRAALIACQIDGLMIIIPQRTTFPDEIMGIEEVAIKSMMHLCMSPSVTKPKSNT